MADVLKEVEALARHKERSRDDDLASLSEEIKQEFTRALKQKQRITKEEFLGPIALSVPDEDEYEKQCEKQMEEEFRRVAK